MFWNISHGGKEKKDPKMIKNCYPFRTNASAVSLSQLPPKVKQHGVRMTSDWWPPQHDRGFCSLFSERSGLPPKTWSFLLNRCQLSTRIPSLMVTWMLLQRFHVGGASYMKGREPASVGVPKESRHLLSCVHHVSTTFASHHIPPESVQV